MATPTIIAHAYVLNFSRDKIFVVNIQPAKTAKIFNLENFRLYGSRRDKINENVHTYMYLRMTISNMWLTTCLYNHTSAIAILTKCRHVHVLFHFTVIVATNEAYLVGLLPLSALSITISWKKYRRGLY